jgi:hypothetical protein
LECDVDLKIGLFYEDKITGELFMLHNFTYSYYVYVNVKGEIIDEQKTDAWEHMSNEACKDKEKIKIFLNNLNFTVHGFCDKCNKLRYSKFQRYLKESAHGDELCTVCKTQLKYF